MFERGDTAARTQRDAAVAGFCLAIAARDQNRGAVAAPSYDLHPNESFALAGDTTTALRLLSEAVERGFYPHAYIAVHCPFLTPLRGSAEFDRIAARAAARVAEFHA